jgi:non-ribosomal peptide synthase protein (TIGR01720 family)
VADVFLHKTPAGLAAAAGAAAPAGPAVPARPAPADGPPTGPLPALPILHWLRELGGGPDGLNQAVVLAVPGGLSEGALVTAVQAVIDRHDSLRLRLTAAGPDAADGGWAVEVRPPGEVAAAACVRRVPAAGRTPEALAALVAEHGEPARRRLAGAGSLLQAVWFDAGPGDDGALLLVAHHLAVDAVSWSILTGDLAAAWTAAADGRAPLLAPVPTALATWARRVQAAATDPAWAAQLPRWSRVLAGPDPLLGARPLDRRRDVAATVTKLVETMPGGLAETATAAGVTVHELLMGTLALTVTEWRRRRGQQADAGVLVDVEGHGREPTVADLDLSRTTGWLTSLFPIRLEPGAVPWAQVRAGEPTAGAALGRVADTLREIPDNGVGFGLLRYLNPAAAELASRPGPQLGFNYLGRTAAGDAAVAAPWTRRTDLPRPAPRDEQLPVAHALQVTARIDERADGPRLSVTWSWAQGVLTRAEITELSGLWREALDGLTAWAGRAAQAAQHADLFLALEQDEIDDLEAELRIAR